jgi:predicted component of type VI protein secretion system
MANSQISQKSAKLTIEILNGPQKGSRRTFIQEEISIGRANENDFSIPDDVKMSRKHARILMTPEGFEIENLTDKNLLFVDGAPTTREKIRNTHKVMLGNTELAVSFDHLETLAASLLQAMPQKNEASLSTAVSEVSRGMNNISVVSAQLQNRQAQAAAVFQQTAQQTAQQPTPQPHLPMRNIGGYQQPIYPASKPHQESSVPLKLGLVLIIGVAGMYFVFFQPSQRKPASNDIYRTSDIIQSDRDKVKKTLDDLDKKDVKLESLQFKRAQENLDKALRDYRNGQYSLARDKFLLVLSLDPLNQTAKRYEQLSRFKLDEQIKYYSLQGRKYYERQNYRLCASSFEKVIILVQKKDDKQFQEAAEFLKLCQQSLNTRYE